MKKIKEEVFKPLIAPIYKKNDYSDSTILTEKERLDKLHKFYKEKKQIRAKQIEEEIMQVYYS